MEESEKRRLLKVRKRISQKLPKFSQFESWRFVRIKDHWKRPKGIDNKMRTKESGWPKSVSIGWRSPKAVRGLHPSGKEEVMVWNPTDLDNVDSETQVARIGGSVGRSGNQRQGYGAARGQLKRGPTAGAGFHAEGMS